MLMRLCARWLPRYYIVIILTTPGMLKAFADAWRYIATSEDCAQNVTSEIPFNFCNVTWDTILCWPPTPPGDIARQHCPSIFGAATDKHVQRKCGLNGEWVLSSEWEGFGHSDYTECIEHLSFIKNVFGVKHDDSDVDDTNIDKPLLKYTLTGYAVAHIVLMLLSIVCIVIVLIIIKWKLPFDVHQSQSFKIWRNLLSSVCMEITAGLLTVIGLVWPSSFIVKSPFCEILVAVLLYSSSTSSLWFLIQTHFQQSVIRTGQVRTVEYVPYVLVGWGLPSIPVVLWTVTAIYGETEKCWTHYDLQTFVWIVLAPITLCTIVTLFSLVRSFTFIFKHSQLIKSSSRYRRLYLETIGSCFYFGFVTILLVARLVHYTLSGPSEERDDIASVLVSVLVSLQGMVLTSFLCCFSTDVRTLVESVIQRFSQQERVPSQSIETELHA